MAERVFHHYNKYRRWPSKEERLALALLIGGSGPGLIDVTTFSTWWWELGVEQNF